MVRILNCFSPEKPNWSLAELTEHLDLPKSTLHRFLESLQFHGILSRDSKDKRYRLGYRLFVWGSLAAESSGLRQIARPVLEDLVAATGESAILTIYRNQEVMCIEKVETSHSVRMTLSVGSCRPPHAGASSKILMAYLPQEEIEAVLRDQGLPKLCANTITDADELMAELAAIRECGYAESCEETDPGAWGVSTPIRDWKGDVVAAIGIAGPNSRFSDELARRYIALCREAAKRVSAFLDTGVKSDHQLPL